MTKANAFNRKVYDTTETDKIIDAQGSKFTGKVFLYMFIALAITALTSLGCGALLTGSEAALDAMGTIVLVSLLLFLPIFIWIQISVLRGGKGLAPAFVIYSAMMGVLLSFLVVVIPFWIVGVAFALTCAAFGVMALIAWTSKKNLSALAVTGYGFLSGILLISLLEFIMYLAGADELALILSGAVSAGLFIFVILITIVDLHNVRQIAARGLGSNNLAMVCAFSLYTDFIYIFVKILTWIIRLLAIIGLSRNR